MRSGFNRVLLAIVAFLAAFVAVQSVMKARRDAATAAIVDQRLSEIQEEATRTRPNIPPALAMQQAATDLAARELAGEPDVAKRALTAANMFWGFYFLNVRERRDLCREQGVDVQPFVEAFTRAHATEFAQAKAITARASLDEERLHALIKAQLRKMVQQDMDAISTSFKVSVREACGVMSENAEAMVAEMRLSRSQPVVARALAGTP